MASLTYSIKKKKNQYQGNAGEENSKRKKIYRDVQQKQDKTLYLQVLNRNDAMKKRSAIYREASHMGFNLLLT